MELTREEVEELVAGLGELAFTQEEMEKTRQLRERVEELLKDYPDSTTFYLLGDHPHHE